jgi:Na+/H+-dicarboxylate symporter
MCVLRTVWIRPGNLSILLKARIRRSVAALSGVALLVITLTGGHAAPDVARGGAAVMAATLTRAGLPQAGLQLLAVLPGRDLT